MFQYAIWRALSLKNKTELKLDVSFLKRMWVWYVKRDFNKNEQINYELSFLNIKNNFASKKIIPYYERFNNKYIDLIIKKLLIFFKVKKHYIEKQFNFDSNILNIKWWYLDWFFQTEKYFIDYRNEIKKDFKFKIEPSIKNQQVISKIEKNNSVSIHIRRWDYVNNKLYFTCHLDYYKKSIWILKKKIKNPVFFFFSDDIKWVRKNLQICDKSYYIDWNNWNKSYEDMRLMSLCKHNIIANSSFSWWWAWLNNNKNKIVIAPSKWFNSNTINYSDIVPDSWIKI